MAELHEREVEEEKVLVKSGLLHVEAWKRSEVFTLNPFKVVYYIVSALWTREEYAVKPEDIVEIN
jgi:hypothetical protein